MLGLNTVASNYSRYLNYTANCVFNFGLQAGFSILLVVTLLALTRPSKRRTPIFLINILALTACIVRVILQACYFWSDSWAYFIQVIVLIDGDVEYNNWRADDPYTWRGQMVAAFFAGLQSTCIFVSLYLQIKAVCAPMVVRWQQTSMMALTGFIAFANIFLAWLHTGLQMQALGDLVSSHGERWSSGIEYVGLWQLISWINQGSVAFFSLIFAAKLAVAVVQRRRLGIKQFGAMEIVLIMSLETMLVPAILVIIQPYTNMPAFASISLTLVTIFLPFSAVWASETLPEEDAESSSRHTGHTSSAASFRTKLFGARTPRRMSSATPSAASILPLAESPKSLRMWRWSWKGSKGKGRESGTSVEVEEKNDV